MICTAYAFVFSISAFMAYANNTPAHLDVVPYPRDVVLGEGYSTLAGEFFIHVVDCTADCDILWRAVERYTDIIFNSPGATGTVFRQNIFEDRVNATVPVGTPGYLTQLNIATTSKEYIDLQLGVDESYSLHIPSGKDDGGVVTLNAVTTWGALHGLETFAQLVQYKSSRTVSVKNRNKGNGDSDGFVINWTPMMVEDAPRYPWRGLLVDSARHFLTVPLLKRVIDTMAAMKLNVMHWHIVDAESFPYVSSKYPDMKYSSTYHPSASYSEETIKDLISYARDRGVRILPEFDTPGHTASVGQTYPELIADCYDWLVAHYGDDLRWPMFNDVALDVTRDETKLFAQNVIQEMSAVFPDQYFHIGGDEVNQGCWNAVPSILTWMEENGFAFYDDSTEKWTYDFTALQASWTTFIQEQVAVNKKSAIVWEESFTLGFELAPDTVVQVWLPDDGTDVLKQVLEAGHKVILSNGWYLDRQAPTCVDDSSCKVNWMWIWSGRDMYKVEPLAPSPSGWVPTEEQAKNILGGEAASWGESVDDKNFEARTWSRTPGIAERLWSPSTYNDPWDLQPRISVLACSLARRGVSIADTQPAFCDYYGEL